MHTCEREYRYTCMRKCERECMHARATVLGGRRRVRLVGTARPEECARDHRRLHLYTGQGLGFSLRFNLGLV